MSISPTTAFPPVITHGDWMAAAAEEYRRIDDLLAELIEADWARPTDCDEWDVHDVVAHLVGAAESNANMRELFRQWRVGRRMRPGAPSVDGMNEVQVRERTGASRRSCATDSRTRDAAACGRALACPPSPAPSGCPSGLRRAPAPSAISWTASTRATRGCTASTSPGRWIARCR